LYRLVDKPKNAAQVTRSLKCRKDMSHEELLVILVLLYFALALWCPIIQIPMLANIHRIACKRPVMFT
jgi:hypothetical protein